MSGRRMLPQLELDCMKVLWKQPSASVAEVRGALPRPLAYTTVMTVLERMSAKGLVERRKDGRAYLYSALLDVEAARQDAVTRVLANLFDNDREALARYVARLRPGPPRSKRGKLAARETFSAPSAIDESLL